MRGLAGLRREISFVNTHGLVQCFMAAGTCESTGHSWDGKEQDGSPEERHSVR